MQCLKQELQNGALKHHIGFQMCQKGTQCKTPLMTTRRYGPLRGPTSSSCGGLRPRLFFLPKKELFMLFWPIFGNFWCPVVTMVTFSSNLINFERNQKKTKNSRNNPTKKSKKFKNPKVQKSPKSSKKSKKNPKKI